MNRHNNSHEDLIQNYTDEIVTMMKSLANDKRLTIMNQLSMNRSTFGDLQDITELSKTALAHHLDVLLKAGMISQMSRGNYELTHDGREFLKSIQETFLQTQIRKDEEMLRRSNYILQTHTKRIMKMNDFKVRIEELGPMQVASVRVISTTPENDAWLKMRVWADKHGLLNNLERHPVFGFNNPNPSKDKPEYGYEFWIKLDPDADYGPSEGVEFKKFQGGKFAVATSKLKEDIDSDGVLRTWKNLVKWAEESEYEIDREIQCLERALQTDVSEDELILDLYLPLLKKK